MGCVYLVENRVNGKRYVGKSVKGLSRRAADHKSDAKRGRNNMLFSRALKKHGPENFEWTVLFDSNSNAKLCEVERVMIAMLQTRSPRGYNCTDGGEGTAGRIASEGTRKKMSAALAGKKRGPHTKEHSEKIGAAQRGKKRGPLTPEHRAKLSEAQKHRPPISDATRIKLSIASKGRKRGPLSVEHKAKISAMGKGRRHTVESIKKMSEAARGNKRCVGRVFTDETRLKLRVARQSYIERLREAAK